MQGLAQLLVNEPLQGGVVVGVELEIAFRRHLWPHQPFQIALHLIGVVRRRGRSRQGLAGPGPKPQGPATHLPGQLRAQPTRLLHLGEHRIAGCEGGLGMQTGVVAMGGGQQRDQQSGLLQAEILGRLVEEAPGAILEAPAAGAQIHPVQIGQEQIPFAEAHLQLQGHQQLPPFARQGLTLAHLLGVEAAGQLLGERAAPFEDAAAEQVGHQGPGRADRINAGVPPEAAVLAGEQGLDQHAGVMPQAIAFPMPADLSSRQRPVAVIAEHQGPADAGEIAPDRPLGQGGEQQQQASGGNSGQQGAQAPQGQLGRRQRAVADDQLGSLAAVRWGQTDAIAAGQQQRLHAAPLQPEAIAGGGVGEQPLAPSLFEPGVMAADGGMEDRQLKTAVPSQAIGAGRQIEHLGVLLRHDQRQLEWRGRVPALQAAPERQL